MRPSSSRKFLGSPFVSVFCLLGSLLALGVLVSFEFGLFKTPNMAFVLIHFEISNSKFQTMSKKSHFACHTFARLYALKLINQKFFS